jgi:hypothetical protein
MQNLIDIFGLCHLLRYEFVFLIELLNGLEVSLYGVTIDGLKVILGLVIGLKGMFDDGVLGLYFLLHVLGDGVLEGCELHINFHYVFMRQQ